MDRKGSRSPARIGGMTGLARSWDTQRPMVRVYRLVVTGLMTTYAGIGGVVVISSWMTAVAISRSMGSRYRVVI